jgi:hypothetical protein
MKARPLVFVLLIAACVVPSFAADDASPLQASTQRDNGTGWVVPFGAPQLRSESSTLLFPGDGTPPLDIIIPELSVQTASCYYMRLYKVKPTERLADNESGSLGYSTCQLAKNYQFRSAVAHSRTAEESHRDASQK